MSKSAKRRAAKKARDATATEAEAEAPAPEPAPAPKAEAKAKAKGKAKAEPAPAKAEPAAKAKAKGKAKAEPAPAKAEPAAKGKAKAEPAPGKAKAAAKAPAKKEPEEPPKPKEVEDLYVQLDDGTGEWEVSSGLSKKNAKRKDKAAEIEVIKENIAAQAKAAGFKPGAPQQAIPGMAPMGADFASKRAAETARMVEQAVAKTLAAAAAAGAAAAAASGANKDKEEPAAAPGSVATVKVPERKIGIVIGPKGARIKMIQEKCVGVTRIDTSGEIFTITGEPKAVAEAELAIKELIEKGYMSLEFEDFAENFVKVHPSSFPDLIGSKGAVVRKIKDELKVEVNFPDVPKNGNTGNKTYKVMLAGSGANVEKAKQVINDICMYYHHELTHPGFVHEELDVEDWALRFIIGKGGSEMKHIQHNWNVKVNVPREHSANQKVVVIGERDNVDRAKAYIEKLIVNAQNQSKGRDKVDDGDVWGEEEAAEAWMSSYIYKRP